jgi:hypothetical protein
VTSSALLQLSGNEAICYVYGSAADSAQQLLLTCLFDSSHLQVRSS